MPLKARDQTKKFLKGNKHKVHIWGNEVHVPIFSDNFVPITSGIHYTTQGIPVIVHFTILDKFAEVGVAPMSSARRYSAT